MVIKQCQEIAEDDAWDHHTNRTGTEKAASGWGVLLLLHPFRTESPHYYYWHYYCPFFQLILAICSHKITPSDKPCLPRKVLARGWKQVGESEGGWLTTLHSPPPYLLPLPRISAPLSWSQISSAEKHLKNPGELGARLPDMIEWPHHLSTLNPVSPSFLKCWWVIIFMWLPHKCEHGKRGIASNQGHLLHNISKRDSGEKQLWLQVFSPNVHQLLLLKCNFFEQLIEILYQWKSWHNSYTNTHMRTWGN